MILSVRADFFGSAAGGGAALELRAPRSGASKQLTIFFEIRSNFSQMVPGAGLEPTRGI